MYTVYDFINSSIDPKYMRFGWKVEIVQGNGLSSDLQISLRYTCLNFDWNSTKFLNNEIWNMFLSSDSYKSVVERLDKAKNKYKRLYFSAFTIEELKDIVGEYGLKIDIEKLIDAAVKRISEEIKKKNLTKTLYNN